jgi:hypothetical protein
MISGGIDLATYQEWAASDALPTITSGLLRFAVPSYTATNYIIVRLFVAAPSGGVAATQRLLSFTQTGTSTDWSLYLNSSGNLDLRGYDVAGTQIFATGFQAFGLNGTRKVLSVELTYTAPDTFADLYAYDVDAGTLTLSSVITFGDVLPANTIGRVTQIRVGEDGGLAGTAVGHLILANGVLALIDSEGAMIAWRGETATDRIARIPGEDEVPVVVHGVSDERVGAQSLAAFLDVLREAADADHGILYEARESLALQYRDRWGLYNQAVTLSLDYTGDDGLVAPLDPVDDDQSVRNDVTVQRTGGASARATLDTGTLSTQAPPDGVGRYDQAVTLNLFDDDQPAQHAGWLLHLGTVDETRYPVVRVDLANAPGMIDDASAVDIGDRVEITNPPAWLPSDAIDLMVQGYTEVLDQYTWTIDFNCTPAAPWDVAVVDEARVDTDGSELAVGVDADDTSLSVAVTAGALWTTTDTPFEVRVGGEVMTVTAVSGASSPQTFTVTRSVNGVTKSHASGADLRLAAPAIVAL